MTGIPLTAMDNREEWKKILSELAAKMPEEAIQRTKKDQTKKGYDTDGFGYQYCVDRFNDVLGLYWGYSWKMENHIEGQYKSGQAFHEISVSVEIWIGEKSFSRGCAGGHTSSNYSDALKGAITNAFKKAASFWGVGRDAYAGTIDDDNQPLPESDQMKRPSHSEEDKAKAAALPESIKSYFRVMKWKLGEVIDFCVIHQWDEAAIKEAIEKLK